MKHVTSLLLVAVTLYSPISAEEVEEIIVTSSYIDRSASQLANPLHVVNRQEIKDDSTENLGNSIDHLLGISSTDFGAAVGQPVIRGMSGNRVKTLSNGLVLRDVSGLGPDHVNDIDMNNVQQIEVVRGPSSLLYANGAIGGIVNIVDNTIARKDFSESEVRVGLESQSVNDGHAYDLSYQNNIGGFNVSAAYKDSEFDDFDIPTGAVIHGEEEEHEEDLGYLTNSDYESSSNTLGFSKVGDWGYVGLSWKNIESSYGIPFHGEGHDDHDGDDDHDEERIFSTTEADLINLEGSFNIGNNWLHQIDYFFRDTDYLLTEQHAQKDEAHEEEGPTFFRNDATEYGAIFDLSKQTFSQKVAINFVQEAISIVGAESFMNPSESDEMTIGYYLNKNLDLFDVDFGIRHDRFNRKGSVTHRDDHDQAEIDYFDQDIKNNSYALNLSRDITESLSASFSFSRVERAPSSTELFMNGPHLATGRYEVGDSTLDSERSNNIDLSFNFQKNGVFGKWTFFWNNVDNYIYLLDETEEQHAAHQNEGEDHDGLILANYLQKDAMLDGYEFEIGKVFEFGNGNLTASYGRDTVEGKFDQSSHIPRLVPSRNIYNLAYATNNFKAALTLKNVGKQSQVAKNETMTESFDMLDIKLTRTFQLNSKSELNLSLFGKNLLDEIARNHSSFVKNEVPLPGRNIGIRLNLNF